MTARNLVSLAAKLPLVLGLSFALSACDTSKAESGPKLPDATGEQAPKRVEIPTPAKAIVGEDAFELSGHLYVLYGTVSIDVYSRGDSDEENLREATAIARKVIPQI